MSSPRRDHRAGFSLIEALASLAIVAALASSVLPFARDAMFRWSAGPERVDLADHWIRALHRLSADLDEALPVPADIHQERRMVFALGPSCLQFARRAIAAEMPGLRLVTYRVARDGGEHTLTRSSVPLSLMGAITKNDGPGVIVLRSVWPMHFEALAARMNEASTKSGTPGEARAAVLVFERGGRDDIAPGPVVLPIPARSSLGAEKQEVAAKAVAQDKGC